VSLVGYTNAGKSTLFNALTRAGAYAADQLFATLDTTTRRLWIEGAGQVVVSDTVGFIRDLPHNLVASFRSTLEEARHADLLLHVVDASHPAALHQIATVNDVLKEIGIDSSEAILVLNKIDAIEDRSYLDVLRASHPTSVSVSALDRTGFDELGRIVSERLSQGYLDTVMETNVANGRLFSYLAAHAEVSDREFHDSRVTFKCRIPRRFMPGLPEDDLKIEYVEGNGTDGQHNGFTTHDGNSVVPVRTV
jgi:GTP-binding protein HflX